MAAKVLGAKYRNRAGGYIHPSLCKLWSTPLFSVCAWHLPIQRLFYPLQRMKLQTSVIAQQHEVGRKGILGVCFSNSFHQILIFFSSLASAFKGTWYFEVVCLLNKIL